MPRNPGHLVITAKGKEGRTYHKEKYINGKVIVHLTKDHKPVLDEKQKPVKVLCDPEKLTLKGFID